ncbi:MAG: adenosyl cobinamide kinase/adenosyl cobinamide phosphate guanylyltransferase [Zhongshania sp.]|jgi:adenosyl cobinamide kinase/adenosyl cobinamide phosphate guanylyltransferase
MGRPAVLELYFGDARSGKLVWLSAEFLSRKDMFSEFISLPLTAGDEEMTGRIVHHQHLRRDDDRQIFELPQELTDVICNNASVNTPILLD